MNPNHPRDLSSTRVPLTMNLMRARSLARTVSRPPGYTPQMLTRSTVDEDDGSDASGSFDDEDSEGEDWDELERKAKRG